MQKTRTVSPFKKTLPALAAGLVMTAFIAIVTLAFGINALFNHNISAASPGSQSAADQASLQDLQATISQYQAREAQYQSELQQAAGQIDQIRQQNMQYQQLIQALQSAGLIQITSDGHVFIPRGAGISSSRGD